MRSTIYQLVLICTLACSSTGLFAQLELGIKAGASVYSGDLSPSTFGIFAEDLNFAGGVYLRYRPLTRLGVRINGNFGRLSAEDIGTFIDEDGMRVDLPRSFRSSLSEFNVVAELDLFYLGDPEANFFAPYVFGGIGVLSYNPQAPDRDGNLVDLQPLRTEGQGLDNTRYAASPYQLTRTVGIFGGGVRVRFAERFVVGLELGGRLTGTDYIDDVGTVRVNYLDIIQGPNGSAAGFQSNPAVTDPSEVTNLEYVRGGEFNDYYFVGGLTFGVTIGGGSNKTGCYSF